MVAILQIIAATVAIFALPGLSQTALTPDQVISNLKELIALSETQDAQARTITLLNGQMITVKEGPLYGVVETYETLVTRTRKFASDIRGTNAITDRQIADNVNSQYRQYMRTQGSIMIILDDRSALFQVAPMVGTPVVDGLSAFRLAVSTLATAISEINPLQAADAQIHTADMVGKLDQTVKSYRGVTGQVKRDRIRGRASHGSAVAVPSVSPGRGNTWSLMHAG